ncbi:MAG: PAS domain-containing sensor histidine kinase [Gemmatimonadaceae bacterium]|nr:PAS domain-containing sensor histidine kinase [Gemmatimonadaceae bacterium]
MKSRSVTVTTWATWLGLFTATTLLLTRLSDAPEVRVAHGVLVYLVLIIGASRQGGRALSLVMVTLGYFAVDWFYVPPRRTLFSAQGLDWFVLIGFVLTGMLISELFAHLQRAAQIARDRTAEVERLSAERLQLERDAATVRVLREADRLKNALIDSIAHDLRSPVATLALVSDPAAGISPEPALQRVQEETQRLGEFLSTLQRFASESGGTPLRTEPHDAHDIIRTAVRTAEAHLRGHTVRTPDVMPGPLVECDHTLTVHALSNLLQNAARYSPKDAAVDVLVESGTTDVHIIVADRGPGIPADEVNRLFSALRRTRKSGSTTRDASQSHDDDLDVRLGMGLAIARTFAHAQRGTLNYRPRTGGGSEFVLRLPRAPITLHSPRTAVS